MFLFLEYYTYTISRVSNLDQATSGINEEITKDGKAYTTHIRSNDILFYIKIDGMVINMIFFRRIQNIFKFSKSQSKRCIQI